MEPGKLTLREAMELLYAKTEIDLDGPGSDNAKNVLQTHPVNFILLNNLIDSVLFRQQVE